MIMIVKTLHTVSQDLLMVAKQETSPNIFKESINRPTGDFFYDPWEIKDEYIGSVWENILDTLPFPYGEARIIVLDPRQAYSIHSDIDDRWHLNIDSTYAYIIDLDQEKMYKSNPDGTWFYMNAGPRHSAVNFGNQQRIQLVVRKLLHRSKRTDLRKIKIQSKIKNLDVARYKFDNSISQYLNEMNKNYLINDFNYDTMSVSMKIAPECIESLLALAENNFEVIIDD